MVAKHGQIQHHQEPTIVLGPTCPSDGLGFAGQSCTSSLTTVLMCRFSCLWTVNGVIPKWDSKHLVKSKYNTLRHVLSLFFRWMKGTRSYLLLLRSNFRLILARAQVRPNTCAIFHQTGETLVASGTSTTGHHRISMNVQCTRACSVSVRTESLLKNSALSRWQKSKKEAFLG